MYRRNKALMRSVCVEKSSCSTVKNVYFFCRTIDIISIPIKKKGQRKGSSEHIHMEGRAEYMLISAPMLPDF